MMQVYIQQQRFDRMRASRVIASTLAILALVVFAATTVVLERAVLSAPLHRALIAGGLTVCLVAFAMDYETHSRRVSSRLIMMWLRSAQADIDEIETEPPTRIDPSAMPGVGFLTERDTTEIQAEVNRLEATFDESERKVEQALVASTVAALTGAIAIVLGVALSLHVIQ